MGFFSKIVKKIKKVFTPKQPEIPEPESGDLVNKDASDASLPIVYGERKMGGTRVYVSTGTETSTNNKYLYICLTLCEGEVESITGIQLNDIPILNVDSSAEDVTGNTITSINGKTDRTLYQIFKGTDSQAASTLLTSAGTEWTSAHKLSGVAYIAIRFFWNADKFSSVPVITAIIKGRKVFNPSNNTTAWSDNPVLCLRDYLTNARYGKGLAASSIDDTSFNAAVLDCNFSVQSYTSGPSIPLLTCNAILRSNKTLFNNVKTLLAGMRGLMPYTNGQYSVFIDRELPSGYTFFSLTPDNMLTDLQVVSTSKKSKYNRVKIKFTNPDTNWQPDFAIWPEAGSSEETAMLANDGGEVMSTETEMSSVTNYYRARDLARIMVLNSRASTFNLEVTGLSECLDIAVGDVVKVEQPSMGWTGAAIQYFRVISTQLMNSGEVDLSLQQYSSSTYIWATGGGVGTPPSTSLPDPFFIGPPTALSATAIGDLQSDGSIQSTIEVEWTPPADAFVDFYDVEWKPQAQDYYSSATSYRPNFNINNVFADTVYDIRVRSVNAIGAKSVFATTTSTGVGDITPCDIPTNITLDEGLKSLTIRWTIPPQSDYQDCEVHRSIASAGTYENIGNAISSITDQSLNYGATRYYKIKSVDYSGNKSAFSAVVSGSTASVGDDAFVGGITSLFENAGLSTITNNGTTLPTGYGASDVGKMHYLRTDNLLYRWTGTEWTKAVPAVDISGLLSDAQLEAIAADKIDGLITDSQLEEIAATKIAGTLSAAQIGAIDLASQVTGQLSNANIAAIAATKISGQLSTAQIGDIDLASQVTGQLSNTNIAAIAATKISGSITNAQLDDIATTKLQGTITGTQIANNAITSAKISANSITSNAIAAGTIVAGDIASNAITTAKLSASAITSDKIAAGTIVAGDIASNAITTAKLATGAITSGKIAAGTITADDIASNAITAVKISANAITSDKIVSGTIVAGDIASNAITTAKLSAGAITTEKIATGQIIAGKIASNAITSAKIAANSITSQKIVSGTIVAGDIASNAITVNKLAAGSITAVKIATDAVTANKILAGTITGNKIVANTITGGLLSASGVITATAQIGDLLVTAAKIMWLTVDSISIANEACTVPRSASGTGSGSNTVGYTWKNLSQTPAFIFTNPGSPFGGLTDRPSKIAIVASVNLTGRSGQGSNRWSCFIRVVAYLPGIIGTVNIAQVGVSIQAGYSDTIVLQHTYTPAANTSGIKFRVDVYTQGVSWTVGQNGILCLGSVK